MRLGGPLFGQFHDPQTWLAALRAAGYSAAYCPLKPGESEEVIAGYARAAQSAGIVIAEVGAWSNPLNPDEATRRKAIEHCQRSLDLADRIGARCCVNIAGSRGAKWDGPCPDDLTEQTFDLIVQTTRAIIDAVRPTRSFFTLETMPWAYPDSADCYLRLMKAIDRKGFAVHLDVVNLVNSPQRFYANTALIRECFAKLGPYIRSCHAKDIALAPRLTVHLDEVRPGLGGLDYPTLLSELNKLDADTPLMLEHLPGADDYAAAARHLGEVAGHSGLAFRS